MTERRRRLYGPLFSLTVAAAGACGVVVDVQKLQQGCVGDTSICCAEGEKYCDGECRSKKNPDYGCARGSAANPSCTPCAPPNAQAVCGLEGGCAIAACFTGFADCDNNANNGCEIDIYSDPKHCGTCTAPLCDDEIPNAETDCSIGTCRIRKCKSNYADCNRQDFDGCEVYKLTDALNCGGCTDPELLLPGATQADGGVLDDFRCAEGEDCINGHCQPAN